MQSSNGCGGKCLAVKLGAEVPDLSESMRRTLKVGTDAIIARIRRTIVEGLQDGSIHIDDTPDEVAHSLYNLWLGASVMAKIARGTHPFKSAMRMTRAMLHLAGLPDSARHANRERK